MNSGEYQDVPEGWASVRFLDVIDYEGGGQPPKKVFVYEPRDGYIRLLQIRDFGEKPFPTFVPDTGRLKKATKDDLLLARYGGDSSDDSLGRVCTGLSGAYNVALVKLVFQRDVVDTGFVRSYFLGPWFKRAISVNSRSCQKGFNRSDLESLTFPLPPLAEQRRIVEKVETLLARVQAARQRLARVPLILKRFRQAVLTAACNGQLTADWRDENPNITSASPDLASIRRDSSLASELELYEIPDTWEWSAIGECFEVAIGGTPSRKIEAYWNGDIPWVSSGEVNFSRITDTREKITDDGLANSNTKLHPRGTVLIGMIGEGKTRGQAAILDIEACNNQNAAAIRVGSTAVPPAFVYYWLWSQYEATRERGAGNSQPALNKERVKAIPLPFPPLAEQHEIVRRVDALFKLADAIERRVTAATARADKLTQAILAKAFRGELVPTEAELARIEGREYESAEQLLELIQESEKNVATQPRKRAWRGK